MAKTKTRFVCQSCGYESARWLGKCPECEGWSTLVEEMVRERESENHDFIRRSGETKPSLIGDVTIDGEERLSTGIVEFDRVLGGGVVRGSLVLIGGDPGIGKSTLMLQMAFRTGTKVLYVSGEESLKQIRVRADRLGVTRDQLFLFTETNLNRILDAVKQVNPDIVVVDSIQTVYREEITSAPGSVSQVRESAAALMVTAKETGFSVFLVGHITKSGMIAGPKVLEHMVDTVLQFEGDRHHLFRILRATKNRFGSTNEIGIFEMHDAGLKEVANPSEIFLSEKHDGASGSVVTATVEGTRPLLVEIQALVSPTNYGIPQRTTSGFDGRRLQLLLAIAEKRAGLRLGAHDVFLNIAGGVKVDEPAVDLAVLMAIASSYFDQPVETKMVVVGEAGLGGEVRTVGKAEIRLREAEKLGFEQAMIPRGNQKGLKGLNGIQRIPVPTVEKAIEIIAR